MRFRDRRDAGRQLAAGLAGMDLVDPVVLAVPRGGVPVAFEVAVAWGVPMEVLVARKIAAPHHGELGMAAIAEGLEDPVTTGLAGQFGMSDLDLQALVARERDAMARTVDRYREGRALPAIARRDAVLVDDGLATGVTAEAALRALRRHRPRRVLLGVPVGAAGTAERLRSVADAVICVCAPAEMRAVGMWYADFTQTSDAEVIDLLAQSRAMFGER